MQTLKVVLVTLASIIILAFATLFLVGYLRPKPAGINIQTNIPASVYFDGNFVGRTPLDITYKAGEFDLKMVPLDTNKNYVAYESKITVASGIKTIIRWEFAESSDAESGIVVSFEKDIGSDATLTVVSKPENAQITLDGISKGFSPVKVVVAPGNHQLSVKSPNYLDQSLVINTVSGYKLTISAQLAKNSTPSLSPSPTPKPTTYMLILQTPTGYLRVRTEPGTNGNEIDQIKPGDKYLLLGQDPVTNWYQIQLEAPAPGLPNGRTGWISNQYAQKIDQSGSQANSPTASPMAAPTVPPNI